MIQMISLLTDMQNNKTKHKKHTIKEPIYIHKLYVKQWITNSKLEWNILRAEVNGFLFSLLFISNLYLEIFWKCLI